MTGERHQEASAPQGGRAGLKLPALLVIMDGFGLAEPGPGNAISQAKTRALTRCSSGARTRASRRPARPWACLRGKWATPRWGT